MTKIDASEDNQISTVNFYQQNSKDSVCTYVRKGEEFRLSLVQFNARANSE